MLRIVSYNKQRFTIGLAILMISCLALLLLSAIASAQQEQDIASREAELKHNLKEIRDGIARYKRACDSGEIGPMDRRVNDKCYPPTLEVLVKGIYRPTDKVKLVFLDRIPKDPMTGKADWGLRSAQDPPDSETWGGENVANVYSKSDGFAIDTTRYKDW